MNVDWTAWLERWDRQQTGYLPEREQRFETMLDVLEVLLPDDFVALDLACGPGAISQRLLRRFPRARCVAVDTDPVLLAIGQGALGTIDGRLRWVKADFTDSDWLASLERERLDAVLSTTALHWLPGDVLVRLCRQLGQLIRPGGVFLNGDHMGFPHHMESFRTVAASLKERRRQRAFERPDTEDWESWWTSLKEEPGLGDLLAERERRLAWFSRGWGSPVVDLYDGALREAGFREVGVIWQQLDNRVLMAVR